MSGAGWEPTSECAPAGISDPRQLELFPGASAVRAEVLEALQRLDVDRALALAAQARESGLSDPDLDAWEAAARWLAPRFSDCAAPAADPRRAGAEPLDPATRAAIAEAFLALPHARRSKLVSRATFDFADETLARTALKSPSAAHPFLDDGERVHLGALRLVRGAAQSAYDLLRASLRSGYADRADLWGLLGDARLRLGDVDGIDECFVRALLLDAGALDLTRTSHRPLAALFERLSAQHSEACARERLLPEAWIARLLSIPIENRWLEPGTLADLRARSAHATNEPARLRRFALLFYLDRSRGPKDLDLAAREEMDTLDHDLLEPCVRAAERGGQPDRPR